MAMKTVKTVWEVFTYPAGFATKFLGEFELELAPATYEAGTGEEYYAVRPTDAQIKTILGTRCDIEVRGDDVDLDIDRASDGHPLAEFNCISHRTLSWYLGEDGPPIAG